MDTNCLIIYPKGDLCERIFVLISALIFVDHKKINLKVIWDHRVPYNYLFLNVLDFIEIKELYKKNYIYNPNVDQAVLYNKIQKNENSDVFIIVSTDKEFNHVDMSIHEYISKRHTYFQEIFRKNISGHLLGQLNLIDFPTKTDIYAFNTQDVELTIPTINLDKEVFDNPSQEYLDFLMMMLYTKFELIVVSDETLEKSIIDATKLSLKPVVSIDSISYYDKYNNYTKGLFGYGLIINPDSVKILNYIK